MLLGKAAFHLDGREASAGSLGLERVHGKSVESVYFVLSLKSSQSRLGTEGAVECSWPDQAPRDPGPPAGCGGSPASPLPCQDSRASHVTPQSASPGSLAASCS